MKKFTIFIDGNSGTTGLNIEKRLKFLSNIEILKANENLKKDNIYKSKLMNESDVVFLCLPDNDAIESAALLKNPNTILIDTSTAHRINKNWTYGFSELSKFQKEKIQSSKKISNPGCHATGFIAIMNPLVSMKIISESENIFCHSITGYSGGGKNMINEFESLNREMKYKAPRQYSLNLSHKHLPEMQKYTNLKNYPIFHPILGNFYSGMAVTVPLFAKKLGTSKNEIFKILFDYYKESSLINVIDENIFLDGTVNPLFNHSKDIMTITVIGNDEMCSVISLFDNLGKGASGAAIQNMNIALDLNETLGLIL